MPRRDAGTGALYEEAKRGRWVGEVVLDGRKRRVMARNKVDAAAKLSALIREHEGGTVALDRSARVSGAVAIWRDRVLPGRTLSASSVALYRWALDLIDAELGTIRLRALDVSKIEDALDRLAAGSQGRPLGKRSLKYVRSTLAQVLDTAIRRKLIGSNPARHAELTPTAAPMSPRRVLDAEGARALWDVLAADDTSTAACFQLQLLTAMRPGEAAGVTWPAVDLKRGLLVVRNAVRVNGRGVAELVPELKTSASFRTIGLPAPAIDVLRRSKTRVATLALAADDWQDHDLCFPSPTGRPLDPANRRRDLAAFCARAGVEVLRPNELRHVAASLLSDAGVALEDIADVTGHAGTRMLDDVYRHRLRPSADAAINVMGDLFGNR